MPAQIEIDYSADSVTEELPERPRTWLECVWLLKVPFIGHVSTPKDTTDITLDAEAQPENCTWAPSGTCEGEGMASAAHFDYSSKYLQDDIFRDTLVCIDSVFHHPLKLNTKTRWCRMLDGGWRNLDGGCCSSAANRSRQYFRHVIGAGLHSSGATWKPASILLFQEGPGKYIKLNWATQNL